MKSRRELRAAAAGNPRITKLHNRLRGHNTQTIRGTGNVVEYGSALLARCSLTIAGNDNRVSIGNLARLDQVTITIRGDGHLLTIGEDCRVNRTEFAFEDRDCTISIGDGTTIDGAHIAAAEVGSTVSIGSGCMLSRDIYVATTDSHSIIDNLSRERINPAQDVSIGDHVWIGRACSILKGSTLQDHVIVGLGSVVTARVEAHSVVAGNPAKVVREGVDWLRPRI